VVAVSLDHEAFGSAPWGYCGLFLADLVPAAGNNDRVAPSKPAMLNGVVDPSSRSIRLTWARCTDNVGVDAYNVYRDGQKIATTGFIDYTDTIQGPVSASYRYSIGAVDVAGNEAKSSEITVAAHRTVVTRCGAAGLHRASQRKCLCTACKPLEDFGQPTFLVR